PWRVLPRAPIEREWIPRAGVISEVACRGIGELAHALGAGRHQAGGAIDPAVGLEFLAAIGDRVGPDRPAVRIHARTHSDAERAASSLERLVTIASHPIAPPPLIRGRVP
ncbi:MAG: hypothetical protein M3252_05985, partial [Actinomycetota bacterium]|nr:hypothetical protein [Actinomycetota bacterium]